MLRKIINTISNLIYRFTKLLVTIYKKFISPYLGNNCRFYPTCSIYYIESLKYNGIIKGHILFLARLIRCNPLYKGGIDYPRKHATIKECISLVFNYTNNIEKS